MTDNIQQAAEEIEASRNLMVLTGAGVSSESGVPTFRGKNGLWDKYDPTELANIESLRRDPLTVWKWYNWRRSLISEVEPNPAHFAVAELEKGRSSGFLLVTQNVDGLHRRAGSKRLVEVHGYIYDEICTVCGWKGERKEPYPEGELPPRCSSCDGIIKPGVVLFGEQLPRDAIAATLEFTARTDVIIVAGTSAVVHPTASIPFEVKQRGGKIIEVNPDETPVTQIADISIRGAAGEILPQIMERLGTER